MSSGITKGGSLQPSRSRAPAISAAPTGEGSRLVADAFHQVAIAGEDIGVMVDDLIAELRRQHPLGERHADRIADPLAERAGRGFDPARMAALRVAGSAAAELPETFQL